MTKNDFLKSVAPLGVVLGDQHLMGNVKQYDSGNVGFNITGKVSLKMPNGEIVRFQMAGNLVAIDSKNWAAGEQAAA